MPPAPADPAPDGYPPLIAAIAAHHRVDPIQVAVAAGATGANFLACAAILAAGDHAIVERPGYEPLHAVPPILGADVSFLDRPPDGWTVDPARLRAAVRPRTRLIVLTTPHNPSGIVTPEGVLREVGAIARAAEAHVLVDEVYRDIASITHPVAARLGDEFITTGSLTKSYGLGSLRCGWTISSPALAERIRRARDVVDNHGTIVTERPGAEAFGLLHALGARARADAAENLRACRAILGGRSDLQWVDPGSGIVIFPRLVTAADSTRFCDRLYAERETAVVPGHFFGAPAHFRIGLGGDPAGVARGLLRVAAALDAGAY